MRAGNATTIHWHGCRATGIRERSAHSPRRHDAVWTLRVAGAGAGLRLLLCCNAPRCHRYREQPATFSSPKPIRPCCPFQSCGPPDGGAFISSTGCRTSSRKSRLNWVFHWQRGRSAGSFRWFATQRCGAPARTSSSEIAWRNVSCRAEFRRPGSTSFTIGATIEHIRPLFRPNKTRCAESGDWRINSWSATRAISVARMSTRPCWSVRAPAGQERYCLSVHRRRTFHG